MLHAGETWLISVDANNQQQRPLHHQQFTLSCSGVRKRNTTTLRSTRRIRLLRRRTNANRCTLKRPASSATWPAVLSPSATTSHPIIQVIHRWYPLLDCPTRSNGSCHRKTASISSAAEEGMCVCVFSGSRINGEPMVIIPPPFFVLADTNCLSAGDYSPVFV